MELGKNPKELTKFHGKGKMLTTPELSDSGRLLMTAFIDKYEKAKLSGVDIGHIILRVLTEVLGRTGAHAVVYIIEEQSLQDPRKFAEGVVKVFGMGGHTILQQLLTEYETFAWITSDLEGDLRP